MGKFKTGDKVKVIESMFKGEVGLVTNVRGGSKCPYTVNMITTPGGSVYRDHELELVESTKSDELDTRINESLGNPHIALAQAADTYSAGRKDDQGKLRYDLVPFDAIDQIVEALNFGAKKYADRNWEKGMSWSRPYGALFRHMSAWFMSKVTGSSDRDEETGLSHLAHAGCCVLFLLAYELRGVGQDDRPIKDGR